ncbi:hypothetical protein BU15DRAFT_67264 [Melanogaster broomeanus]|nr:hypothetical protein BU15DRAFT_67264 [Melanogaster broomeanus]
MSITVSYGLPVFSVLAVVAVVAVVDAATGTGKEVYSPNIYVIQQQEPDDSPEKMDVICPPPAAYWSEFRLPAVSEISDTYDIPKYVLGITIRSMASAAIAPQPAKGIQPNGKNSTNRGARARTAPSRSIQQRSKLVTVQRAIVPRSLAGCGTH